MYCQNCGQVSAQASNFCRFCGTKFTSSYSQNGNDFNVHPVSAPVNFEYAPPRPYVWKTDEYQIQDEKTPKAKTINRVQPLAGFQTVQSAVVQPFQQSQAVSHEFHCPRCNSRLYPRAVRQISTGGWITFAVLLVTIPFLFWIGLLIKEDIRVCPVCNFKYS